MRLDDFLPFVILAIMYLLGGNNSFIDALKMFSVIIMSGGFFFSIIAINGGHQHPDVLHDGDPMRLVLIENKILSKIQQFFFLFLCTLVKIWIGEFFR